MKTIILHGWGHNAQLWQGLADKLPDTVAIDLPGFGDELLVKDDWGIPQYADWVQEKIKKNNHAILIGHSFGGRVAAEIASKQSKNLKALVLAGAPCLYRPTKKTKLKIKLYKSLKTFLPENTHKIFYSEDLKFAGELKKIFRKVVVYDQTRKLKKINVPTLLIWGENDDQAPLRIAEEMSYLIPNSELKIIEKAGHNAFLEKPNLFFGWANEFIKNIPNL